METPDNTPVLLKPRGKQLFHYELIPVGSDVERFKKLIDYVTACGVSNGKLMLIDGDLVMATYTKTAGNWYRGLEQQERICLEYTVEDSDPASSPTATMCCVDCLGTVSHWAHEKSVQKLEGYPAFDGACVFAPYDTLGFRLNPGNSLDDLFHAVKALGLFVNDGNPFQTNDNARLYLQPFKESFQVHISRGYGSNQLVSGGWAVRTAEPNAYVRVLTEDEVKSKYDVKLIPPAEETNSQSATVTHTIRVTGAEDDDTVVYMTSQIAVDKDTVEGAIEDIITSDKQFALGAHSFATRLLIRLNAIEECEDDYSDDDLDESAWTLCDGFTGKEDIGWFVIKTGSEWKVFSFPRGCTCVSRKVPPEFNVVDKCVLEEFQDMGG